MFSHPEAAIFLLCFSAYLYIVYNCIHKYLEDNSITNVGEKKTYYSSQGNFSLLDLYNGDSVNVSTQAIYAIDYNSSVYQFVAPVNISEVLNLRAAETVLTHFLGWDGEDQSNNQLMLTLLTSGTEKCVSFDFQSGEGALQYKLSLQMFFEQGVSPILRGYMSLPNQARSFDRYRLFKSKDLPENIETIAEYSVNAMKFLQKRSTDTEPCVNVDNYDKWLEMEIMKKFGCRPPYWEVQTSIPNCTSIDQLQSLSDYAVWTQRNVLRMGSVFSTSCKQMELVVIGNTTIIPNDEMRNFTATDGTKYTERKLSLKVEFIGGLFTKIEQKVEYTVLSMMAELGGYMGLLLGYSLFQISGPLTIVWIKLRGFWKIPTQNESS